MDGISEAPRSGLPASRRCRRIACEYGLALLLCAAALTWALQLWRSSLQVPYTYGSDALLLQAWIQSMMDDGWYLHSNRLGMPFGSDIHDFPQADCLHYVLMKWLALAIGDAGAAMNLYFLLTFPFTILTSLFVLRHFGIRYGPALACSLLYTFLPFHLLRYAHLCLAAYYLVPLMVMVVLWIYLGRWTLQEGENALPERDGSLGIRKTIASAVVALLAASGGAYYACFFCFFLILTGLAASILRRTWWPIGTVALLLGCIGVGALPDILPTVQFWRQNGPNPDNFRRTVADAETYGLKITQMLLPVSHHRLSRLAAIKDEYNERTIILNENDTGTLGAVGSMGFLLLLGRLVIPPRRRVGGPLDALAMLNVSAVMLGTLGGLGALASVFGMTWVRGYNRISVFIGFFALFAMAWVLSQLGRRLHMSRSGVLASVVLCSGMMVLGLLDQVPPSMIPDYPGLKTEYLAHRAYMQRVEASLPAATMVLQFPIRPYPQDGAEAIHGYRRYDHLLAFVHARTLRFSYGAFQGREGDTWQQTIAEQPMPDLLELASDAGFGAVYVDRFAYPDRGKQLEADIRHCLGGEPLVSEDGRMAVFDMTPFNEGLRRKYTPKERLERQIRLVPMAVKWHGGFSQLESDELHRWRWCGQSGKLSISNSLPVGRTAKLTMQMRTDSGVPCRVKIDGDLLADLVELPIAGCTFSRTLHIPPGKHTFHFQCDGQPLHVPGDKRPLVFRVLEFRLENLTSAGTEMAAHDQEPLDRP